MTRKKRFLTKPTVNKVIIPTNNEIVADIGTNKLDKPLQTPHAHSNFIPEQALPTIASKAMFWRPRYLAESNWLQHVPFYFWLIEVLQPKIVVESNIDSAVGYFAICQAIDKLNQDGLIYGALGANSDAERITDYNHEHYREFSNLTSQTEERFINNFSDNSIDLLLIKSNSSLFGKELNLTNLRKYMSHNGVILIHGTNQETLQKQCSILKTHYSTFELTQSPGLLLICLGQQIPARLEMLINQSKEPSSQRLAQNIFARLGSASEDSWYRLSQQKQILQMHDALEKANNNQIELTLQLQQQQQNTVTTLAALNAECNDLREINNRLQSDLDEQRVEFQKCKQSLQQDLQTRFDELAALTKLLVSAEAANEKSPEILKVLTSERDILQVANNSLKADQQQLEKILLSQKTELSRLKEYCAMLERDQTVAAERIATLTQNELELQQALAARFDELAALTNQLVEMEQGHQRKQQEVLIQASETQQANSRVGLRLKATLNAVKPQKGKARLAKKVLLIRESQLFDETWYLQQYPEAVTHSYGAAGHYLEIGAAKGANPSPRFDGNAYLQANQDVKQAGMNPLYHYINFGRAEGRSF
ncbi:hypothetical protein [Leclercia adecarboxylata]|uniref:hypothetical protein n=1 Tax=Leclercia adecarboxylata TaxID=83655 RepID=UPI003182D262